MSTNQSKTKGKWQKGTSGNPAGRPIGSRNKSSLLLEQLLEDEGEVLMRKAIEKAKKGDSTALRLCLDRLCPPKRDRHVEFPLPEITSPSQLSSATGAILAAVARGELTPNEADTIVRILHSHVKIMETDELTRKIEQLESLILLPVPKRRKTALEIAFEEEVLPPDPFAGDDPPINLSPPSMEQATNDSAASTTDKAPEQPTASPAAEAPSTNSTDESAEPPARTKVKWWDGTLRELPQ